MKVSKFIFICSVFILSSCADKNDTTTPTTVNLNPSTMVSTITGNSFTIPDNVISFSLAAFGDFAQEVKFDSLTNPANTNLLSQGSELSGRVTPDMGFTAALFPMISNLNPTAGTWQFSHTNAQSIKLTLRTGTSTPTAATFTAQPYLAGTSNYTSTQIDTAMNVMKQIYAENGITINVNSTITVAGTQYDAIVDDVTNVTTAELITRGAADTVNLFFIPDFSTTQGMGTLGFASGIPGALGIKGNRNGVLIGMAGHLRDNTLQTTTMGETVAHEMGHWLGLFHTTEETGAQFDPLNDTSECTKATFDTDGFAGMSAEECQNVDGTNLMFWVSGDTIPQRTLSAEQKRIIVNSPIAL